MRVRTTIIIIAMLLGVSAVSFAQQITIKKHNVGLKEVLREIRRQSGYDILFKRSILTGTTPVNISLTNASLKAAMDAALNGQPLSYAIDGKAVILSLKKTGMDEHAGDAALITVSGHITDDTGVPLAGATVRVKDGKRLILTDANGGFVLSGIPEKSYLTASFIGFESRVIQAVKNMGTLSLIENKSLLTEINISANTGYQRIPKERATGAFDVIDARQISGKIQTNVLERLEGLAAGLVMTNGIDDGTDDGLTIRGITTLYGTKRPLIVVDNFPIEGDISTVNPNDVESITILKDAAAASIWGARAANGVIVLTTKKGSKEETRLTYTNSFQIKPKPNLAYLNRLNAAGDIAVEHEILKDGYDERFFRSASEPFSGFTSLFLDSLAGRLTPSQYLDAVNRLSGMDNTSQIKELMMQQPFTQNHSLSITSGSEKNRYYASINYIDRNGYNLKDHNSIFNLFMKSNHQISKKLDLSINVNLNTNTGTDAPVSAADIYRLKPYEMLQDGNGNPRAVPVIGDPANQNNSNMFTIAQRIAWGLGDESYYPLKELDNTEITRKKNLQRIQASLNYKIAAGINLNFNYQLEQQNMHNERYIHADEPVLVKEINDYISPTRGSNYEILTNPDGTLLNPVYNLPIGGKLIGLDADFTAYVIRGLININKTIAVDHEISGIAGLENSRSKGSGNEFTKYGYDNSSLSFVDIDVQRLKALRYTMQAAPTYLEDYIDQLTYKEDRFVSAFANAAYSYKRKYIYSGSIRIDQTNLFGADPKYLYRPMWSSGLSWILSNEDFLKNNDLINYLQFRATYGINGNIPKNSGPFMIAIAEVNRFNNLSSNTVTTPANSNLRWEKTAVTNFGLDFSILKNRISGKLDFYLKRSSDLLGDDLINPTFGFSTALLNTAGMRNNGFELVLTSQNIRNRNFSWLTNFNFATNKNRITKVALSPGYSNPRFIAAYNPGMVGTPYKSLFSIRYGGLTHDNGQLLLKNAQGDIEPDALNSNMDFAYYTGSTRPTSTGALSNTFSYRNLELSFMFVFYLGHVARQNLPIPYPQPTAFDGRLRDAWKKPGDEQFTHMPNIIWDMENHYYPLAYYSDLLDVNVFNASYAKLRELSLTYNFPANAFSKIKAIKGLQLNVHARNLWTLAENNLGIDPEAFANGERTVPIMPTYAFGINLNF
jgi:TonB-linked SusC/RagA family outer membrane protein